MNRNILTANLFTPGLNGRWGLPRLYWGPPGIGKSAGTNQVVHGQGMVCKTLISSILDPSDIAGIPVPHDINGTIAMHLAPPAWAVELSQLERGVLFLDEIGDASPAVQAALMQVVLEGRCGQFKLPNKVRIIAAANPPEMAANGFDMAPPLANRFGHEDVNYSAGAATMSRDEVDEWSDWLISSGRSNTTVNAEADPEALEKRVLNAWPNAYARARGEVVAFMASAAGGPSALFSYPSDGDQASSRAWASKRSWECATRVLASSRVHGMSLRDRETWMASHVGIGPIAAFCAFVKDADLPDPREFLAKGGDGWKHDPSRLDRTLALLTGCTTLVIDMEPSDQRAEFVKVLWHVIRPIAEASADVCVRSVTNLIYADLSESKDATRTMSRMRPVLRACGVV
jgi:hypothetical protein